MTCTLPDRVSAQPVGQDHHRFRDRGQSERVRLSRHGGEATWQYVGKAQGAELAGR